MTTVNKRCRSGFTLLELLVVMAIMIMMAGIGITGYMGIRRGAEMRGAVSAVRTTLMLARQQAVTKRRTVTVSFLSTNMVPGTTSHFLRIAERNDAGSNINPHADAYLPVSIEFFPVAGPITFRPSGTAGGVGTASITVREKELYQRSLVRQSQTIKVWTLTGVTKVGGS